MRRARRAHARAVKGASPRRFARGAPKFFPVTKTMNKKGGDSPSFGAPKKAVDESLEVQGCLETKKKRILCRKSVCLKRKNVFLEGLSASFVTKVLVGDSLS